MEFLHHLLPFSKVQERPLQHMQLHPSNCTRISRVDRFVMFVTSPIFFERHIAPTKVASIVTATDNRAISWKMLRQMVRMLECQHLQQSLDSQARPRSQHREPGRVQRSKQTGWVDCFVRHFPSHPTAQDELPGSRSNPWMQSMLWESLTTTLHLETWWPDLWACVELYSWYQGSF